MNASETLTNYYLRFLGQPRKTTYIIKIVLSLKLVRAKANSATKLGAFLNSSSTESAHHKLVTDLYMNSSCAVRIPSCLAVVYEFAFSGV